MELKVLFVLNFLFPKTTMILLQNYHFSSIDFVRIGCF